MQAEPSRNLSVALAFLCASCASYEEVRLPTFEAAMALATTEPEPAFFEAAKLPYDMPLAAPYVHLARDFPTFWKLDVQMDALLHECADRELRPDFLVYESGGLTSPGSTLHVSPTYSTGGLYGLSFSSSTVVLGRGAITCYRLAPVSLGVRLDGNWMVTHVGESARSSGLQEGDSIQSVDGDDMRPRTPQNVSPWVARALAKKPGQAVEIEWIRSGTGRMRGILMLQKPEPLPADAKPWRLPKWEDRR